MIILDVVSLPVGRFRGGIDDPLQRGALVWTDQRRYPAASSQEEEIKAEECTANATRGMCV